MTLRCLQDVQTKGTLLSMLASERERENKGETKREGESVPMGIAEKGIIFLQKETAKSFTDEILSSERKVKEYFSLSLSPSLLPSLSFISYLISNRCVSPLSLSQPGGVREYFYEA
jgi:hypothetical protein